MRHASREFGNFILRDGYEVTQNHKHGLSLNVLNTTTATEWRLSWIGANQALYNGSGQFAPYALGTKLNFHQKSNTFFAGVSWQLSPRVRSRLTHMSSSLKSHCELLTPSASEPCQFRFQKASTVLELAYQVQAADIVSLAVSTYPIEWVDYYKGRHQSAAVAWRRDWGQGWFSSAQLMRATNSIRSESALTPYPNGRNAAWAAGLRVGYAY